MTLKPSGVVVCKQHSRRELLQMVLGNSTEWIFDIRRLDRAQKGGFHYPYWILGRRKVNKCTEMDENKVECGKIP